MDCAMSVSEPICDERQPESVGHGFSFSRPFSMA